MNDQEQQSLKLPPWLVKLRGLRDQREAFKAAHPFTTDDPQEAATAETDAAKDQPEATDDAPPKAGQKMEDGTFYLGRFKNKDGIEKDWFAAAEDAKDKNGKRLSLSFKQAALHALCATAHDHSDWKVPPGFDDPKGEPDILKALFNNAVKLGGFKTSRFDPTGRSTAGWYWSSTPLNSISAHCRNFKVGAQGSVAKMRGLPIRLVRSVSVVQS